MNRFIRNTVIFFSILLIYFGIVGAFNYYTFTCYECDLEESNILIIGDSHIEKSLDPEQFSSAINISQPSEGYILSYWKLKSVLRSFHPDTVIIGFSPHNLSAFNDMKFSHKKWADKLFKRSYAIQEFNSLNSVEVDYNKFYKVFLKQMCFIPKIRHCNHIGNYFNFERTDLSKADRMIDRHYYYEGEELGISKTAISYLDSLLAICKSNEIQVVLLAPPVHTSYMKKIPAQYITAYHQVSHKSKAQGVIVIDYSSIEYADSLFLDNDHLNTFGAIRFSNEIKELLKNGYSGEALNE